MNYLIKTEVELMFLAGKGDTYAKQELQRRYDRNAKEYQDWRTANPGRSAAAAFS